MNLFKKATIMKSFTLFVLAVFVTSVMGPVCPQAHANTLTSLNYSLPTPGQMIQPTANFSPTLLRGMTVDLDNPLQFDFIVTQGDNLLDTPELKKESMRLIEYFLTALTIPEEDLWVNLSPHEKGRILPDALGQTAMGRDLLAQDYLLKQFTASLIYPEQEFGAAFWEKIYNKLYKEQGTTDIPINTFNKVWIVPETATVYQHQNNAFVAETHLRVMLESDYLAFKEGSISPEPLSSLDYSLSSASRKIIKKTILPAIEQEVNEGAHFAKLRQVTHALILATWFKKTLKNSLVGEVYTNQNKTTGIKVDDPTYKETIYNQYLEAYKRGVYHYIKEEYDLNRQEVLPREYFSGGVGTMMAMDPTTGMTGLEDRVDVIDVDKAKDHAMASIEKLDLQNPDKTQLISIKLADPLSPKSDQAMAVRKKNVVDIPEVLTPLVYLMTDSYHLSVLQSEALESYLNNPSSAHAFISFMTNSLADGEGKKSFAQRLALSVLQAIARGTLDVAFPQLITHNKYLDDRDIAEIIGFAAAITQKLTQRKKNNEFIGEVPSDVLAQESELLAQLLITLTDIKAFHIETKLLTEPELKNIFLYYLNNEFAIADITTLSEENEEADSLEDLIAHAGLINILLEHSKTPALKAPAEEKAVTQPKQPLIPPETAATEPEKEAPLVEIITSTQKSPKVNEAQVLLDPIGFLAKEKLSLIEIVRIFQNHNRAHVLYHPQQIFLGVTRAINSRHQIYSSNGDLTGMDSLTLHTDSTPVIIVFTQNPKEVFQHLESLDITLTLNDQSVEERLELLRALGLPIPEIVDAEPSPQKTLLGEDLKTNLNPGAQLPNLDELRGLTTPIKPIMLPIKTIPITNIETLLGLEEETRVQNNISTADWLKSELHGIRNDISLAQAQVLFQQAETSPQLYDASLQYNERELEDAIALINAFVQNEWRYPSDSLSEKLANLLTAEDTHKKGSVSLTVEGRLKFSFEFNKIKKTKEGIEPGQLYYFTQSPHPGSLILKISEEHYFFILDDLPGVFTIEALEAKESEVLSDPVKFLSEQRISLIKIIRILKKHNRAHILTSPNEIFSKITRNLKTDHWVYSSDGIPISYDKRSTLHNDNMPVVIFTETPREKFNGLKNYDKIVSLRDMPDETRLIFLEELGLTAPESQPIEPRKIESEEPLIEIIDSHPSHVVMQLSLEEQRSLWRQHSAHKIGNGRNVKQKMLKANTFLTEVLDDKILKFEDYEYVLQIDEKGEIVVAKENGTIIPLQSYSDLARDLADKPIESTVFFWKQGLSSEVLVVYLAVDSKVLIIKRTNLENSAPLYEIAFNSLMALEFEGMKNTFPKNAAKILFSQRKGHRVKNKNHVQQAHLIIKLLTRFKNSHYKLPRNTAAAKFYDSLKKFYIDAGGFAELFQDDIKTLLLGVDTLNPKLNLAFPDQEVYYFPPRVSEPQPRAMIEVTRDGYFIVISGDRTVGVFTRQQLEENHNADAAMAVEKNLSPDALGGMDLNTAQTNITVKGKAPLTLTNPSGISTPDFVIQNFRGFRADFIRMQSLSINQILPLFGL